MLHENFTRFIFILKSDVILRVQQHSKWFILIIIYFYTLIHWISPGNHYYCCGVPAIRIIQKQGRVPRTPFLRDKNNDINLLGHH